MKKWCYWHLVWKVFPVLLIWFQEVWTCKQNNYFQEYKYQYWYINLSIEYQFQECLLSMGYSKENQIEMVDGALRVLQRKISSRFFDVFMTKLVPRLSTRPFAWTAWTLFPEFYFQRQNRYFLLYKQCYVTSFRFLVIFSFFSVSEPGSSHDKEKRLERKYPVVHKCSYCSYLALFQSLWEQQWQCWCSQCQQLLRTS